MKKTRLAIIGSGPAGLTASIYASRYQVENIVFGQQRGGTIGLAHAVENYPGFNSISGLELMGLIEKQVVGLGTEIVYDPAVKLAKSETGFRVQLRSGEIREALTLLLATGTRRRKLGVSGEEDFLGRGVSYCTTCDAPFFKEKRVAVIGGGDSAVSGALHAAAFASRVYLIYRGEKLRAEPIWINQALKNHRIEPIYRTNITMITGENIVEAVGLDNAYKGENKLTVDGVFIEIGGQPVNDLASQLGLNLNEAGYIKVDQAMRTSLEGVFAAGDNTDFWPHFQQMVTAQAQGAVAATSVYEYLQQK